jgi:hypothetical protein
MLKLLEDMHMTHKKYVCCCHAWDKDACKVLGCDSKSKLAFGDTTEVDTMVWKKHILMCKMSPASHFFLMRKVKNKIK